MRASAPLLTGVATQALSVWLRKVGMGRYALPDLRQAGSRSLDLSVQSTSGSYGSGGRMGGWMDGLAFSCLELKVYKRKFVTMETDFQY